APPEPWGPLSRAGLATRGGGRSFAWVPVYRVHQVDAACTVGGNTGHPQPPGNSPEFREARPQMTGHHESTGPDPVLSSDSVRRVTQYQTAGVNARARQ